MFKRFLDVNLVSNSSPNSYWKVFTKAGKPGWAAIIPIYNMIVLLEVTKQPLWMIILFFLPVANLIALIIVNIELAKLFNKINIPTFPTLEQMIRNFSILVQESKNKQLT